MPASHRSVFITRINCGLFHLLCVRVFGSIFSVNKMNISNTLRQEGQFKYHLHTFEFRLCINEGKSMQKINAAVG